MITPRLKTDTVDLAVLSSIPTRNPIVMDLEKLGLVRSTIVRSLHCFQSAFKNKTVCGYRLKVTSLTIQRQTGIASEGIRMSHTTWGRVGCIIYHIHVATTRISSMTLQLLPKAIYNTHRGHKILNDRDRESPDQPGQPPLLVLAQSSVVVS